MSGKIGKKNGALIAMILLLIFAVIFGIISFLPKYFEDELKINGSEEFQASVQRIEVDQDNINIYLNEHTWYLTTADKNNKLQKQISSITSGEQIYYRIKLVELEIYPNFPEGDIIKMEIVSLRTENAELMSVEDYNHRERMDFKKIQIFALIIAFVALGGAISCLVILCKKKSNRN